MAARIPGLGRVVVSDLRSISTVAFCPSRAGSLGRGDHVIVVGVDGGDLGKEALRFALHEAALRGTRVRAVHVWQAVPLVTVTGPGFVPPLDPEPIHEAAIRTLCRHRRRGRR